MGRERRNRTRVPIQFDVTVSLRRRKIKVQTLNISLTGILCSPDPLFKQDDVCKVTIDLGAELQIVMAGKVIRCDDREVAIAFTSLTEESFFHLKRLVQYNYGDADSIDAELKKPVFSS